jgi:site-specific DNA recombinase
VKGLKMVKREFFKKVFDSLARDGFIGDRNGEIAYCYLRVSSLKQADEGSSGLPRQIQHIHDAAIQKGYKVPWELVFADDHTGFEFMNRPELSRLRKEYKSKKRRAKAIIMEYLDRLSRNSDWHQGFLLDEMERYELDVIFWDSFSSRIEYVMMGAISQEGMKQAKQRMSEGNIYKARDGRVTARTPAYGYVLADSQGRIDGISRKDTHYMINDQEASVVRNIFEQLVHEGRSLRTIAVQLEQSFPPPKRMSHWEPKLIALIVRNSVYKGEFIAHRWQHVKVPVQSCPGLLENPPNFVSRKIQRPCDEWIVVPVPPIVDEELWEKANQLLDQNIGKGRHIPKEPFLLTGLVKCATCGHAYVGGRRIKQGKREQTWRLNFYRCAAKSSRLPQVKHEISCNQSQISCSKLDNAVWSTISRVLLEPHKLVLALERKFYSEDNEQLNQQVAFLESQIQEKQAVPERYYGACLSDRYEKLDYHTRIMLLRKSEHILLTELERLKSQTVTWEMVENKKRRMLHFIESANMSGSNMDAPFLVRRSIITAVVDRIVLNVNEGWFKLEGVLGGEYRLPG